jgi:lysophospholipase L1-like esterase
VRNVLTLTLIPTLSISAFPGSQLGSTAFGRFKTFFDIASMKVVRPHTTLLFITAVGVACLMLSLVFPSDGIPVFGYKLKFKTWDSSPDSAVNKIEDVGAYLAMLDSTSVDTTSTDSLSVVRKTGITSLQFANDDSSPLFSFFEALDSAKAGNGRVHVFHYGDSQIESDRMSNVLREKMQTKFGGSGCGLVAPVPITGSGNILQAQSENWKRHTSYGFDDGKVSHNNFGVMCAFGRFTPTKKKEDIVVTDSTEAWIELRPSSMATDKCKSYTEVILYFGNCQYGFRLNLYDDGKLISTEDVSATASIESRHWNLAGMSKKLRFEFKGPDSPDVYGIELHGSGGVNLSNIALRGNDGGAFRRVNGLGMKTVFDQLDAELFILQFGGNAVPYLSGESSARAYGNAFRSHIQMFKRLRPNTPIIVVGPSDMSTSIDGVYQTWPYLESLKEGMKEAALAEGCAFWDMFEVMGGKNSMISWVTNDPPYAGPDYTHFTPAGARKVAELLYKAIDEEYEAWKAARSVQSGEVKVQAAQ